MNSEDWSMLSMVFIVVVFIVGVIDFELALLLMLLNISAIMADYSAEH